MPLRKRRKRYLAPKVKAEEQKAGRKHDHDDEPSIEIFRNIEVKGPRKATPIPESKDPFMQTRQYRRQNMLTFQHVFDNFVGLEDTNESFRHGSNKQITVKTPSPITTHVFANFCSTPTDGNTRNLTLFNNSLSEIIAPDDDAITVPREHPSCERLVSPLKFYGPDPIPLKNDANGTDVQLADLIPSIVPDGPAVSTKSESPILPPVCDEQVGLQMQTLKEDVVMIKDEPALVKLEELKLMLPPVTADESRQAADAHNCTTKPLPHTGHLRNEPLQDYPVCSIIRLPDFVGYFPTTVLMKHKRSCRSTSVKRPTEYPTCSLETIHRDSPARI